MMGLNCGEEKQDRRRLYRYTEEHFEVQPMERLGSLRQNSVYSSID